MKNASRIVVVLFAAVLMSLFSCSPSKSVSAKTVSIDGVGFYTDNTPADWWTNRTQPLLVHKFNLYFKGDIQATDVKSARVYLPNGSTDCWTLDAVNDFDAASKSIGGYSACSWQEDNSRVPIGTMKAEIVLQNGNTAESYFTVCVPGSTSPGSYQSVYSSEDESAPTGTSYLPAAPVIRRATVNSYSNNGSTITCTFTVHGSNVHNGAIFFYDSTGAFVGESITFLDRTTGAAISNLSGAVFNAGDGQQNTLTFSVSGTAIINGSTPITSAKFSSIQHCRVVMLDGLQYAGLAGHSYASFDYRSVSEYF